MRLSRFFVDGFPRGTSARVTEFLLFHGVGSVKVIDRPDLERLEVVCFYNLKEGS
jgi:hypothetical protein